MRQDRSDDVATAAAVGEGRPAFVWQRTVADTLTPVAAGLALMVPGRGDFLLESVEGGQTRGRYSLIGLAPDLVFTARGDRASIDGMEVSGSPLDVLRGLVAECRAELPPGLPRALACLVGFFAYETIGLIERLPRPPANPLDLPDMVFVRPTLILAFDRLADELFLVAPLWPGEGDAGERVRVARERIGEALSILSSTPVRPELVEGLPFPSGETEQGREDFDKLSRNRVLEASTYRSMVARAQAYITAGDIFQVVLAQRFTVPFSLPPFALYRSLRRVNPSPFLYFLDLPGFALIGSSPEILVRVRDGEVTVRPIAGTRPRGATAAEDAANRDALLADPKERAEHLMLLDLGRNDVGRVAEPGSVRVTDSYLVELYSHVMHIVSNVVGRLDPARDAIDALFAGFPAGTVSGAPKVRACEIIAELEPETRGAYAGGVGYFSPDGSMDSCIVLRTAVVKDGAMHVQAGAGIVVDSDPAAEQRECEAKAGALFAAAREALGRSV